jgi:hypothetical protein
MTDLQKSILDWQITEGAEKWYANAVAVFGRDEADIALESKVARYADQYAAATDKRPASVRRLTKGA